VLLVEPVAEQPAGGVLSLECEELAGAGVGPLELLPGRDDVECQVLPAAELQGRVHQLPGGPLQGGDPGRRALAGEGAGDQADAVPRRERKQGFLVAGYEAEVIGEVRQLIGILTQYHAGPPREFRECRRRDEVLLQQRALERPGWVVPEEEAATPRRDLGLAAGGPHQVERTPAHEPEPALEPEQEVEREGIGLVALQRLQGNLSREVRVLVGDEVAAPALRVEEAVAERELPWGLADPVQVGLQEG